MSWILTYFRVDFIPRITALIACGSLLFTPLYLMAEKSILISVCPQLVPAEERYAWYHEELMHSIGKHRFKNAGLMADKLASLKMNRIVSPYDDPLGFYDLLILGRYSELLAMLQTSYNPQFNWYYGHYLKAEALLGLHEYKNARDEFIVARSLAAEQPCLLLGLMKANLALGNRIEAKYFLRELHSKASARWIDAYLALVELKPSDEISAQRIAIEFVNVMSEPLDDCEAVSNLDFVSAFMLDHSFKRQARMLAMASGQIKEK
jgi:hypothetical protein